MTLVVAEEELGELVENKGGRELMTPQPPPRSVFREYLEVAMWGLPLFLFFSHFVAQNFKIPTESMENSLLIGDHLTVNKFVYGKDPLGLFPNREPKRGEVVVFKFPGNVRQFWVKRLIGIPGDRLEIINDHLKLNDALLDEPYAFYKVETTVGNQNDRDPEIANRPEGYYSLKPGLDGADYRRGEFLSMAEIIARSRETLKRYYAGTDPKTFRRLVERLESGDGKSIPPGFFFVMGDNRNRSLDSRRWGFVPRELMEGRAYWVWWSYGEEEGTHEKHGLGLAMVYLRYPVYFWTRTHWAESMRRVR